MSRTYQEPVGRRVERALAAYLSKVVRSFPVHEGQKPAAKVSPPCIIVYCGQVTPHPDLPPEAGVRTASLTVAVFSKGGVFARAAASRERALAVSREVECAMADLTAAKAAALAAEPSVHLHALHLAEDQPDQQGLDHADQFRYDVVCEDLYLAEPGG